MKNNKLLIFLAMSSIAFAGGDLIQPVQAIEEVFVPIEPVPIPVSAPKVVPPPPVAVKKPTPLPYIDVNGLYVGLGLSLARFSPSCGCTSAKGQPDKTAGIIARIGYDFNQYFGIEARGIRTNWKSDGGKIKHVGLFAKPMYPVSTATNIYGLVGYGKTTTQGMKQYVNAKTLGAGLGIEYDLAPDTSKRGRYDRAFDGYGDQEGGWGLFADYERLVLKQGSPDLDTINFGLTYDF